MKRTYTLVQIILIAFCVFAFATHAVAAKDWPSGPVTLIVPFNPGGTVDRQARPFAPVLQDYLGVPVKIENVPGGGTVVGTKEMLNRPLGSAFLFGSQPHLSGAIIRTGAFSLDDFSFVTATQDAPAAVIVATDGPYDTFQDLLQDLRNNPKQVRGAAIPGTLGHILIDQFAEFVGVEANFVPYDGGSQTRSAVMGGHVEYTITDPEGTRASAPEELKCIAMSKPHPGFPNVPTINEALQKMEIDEEVQPVSFVRYIAADRSFKEKSSDNWNFLVNSIEKAIKDPRYQEWSQKSQIHIEWVEPQEAVQRIELVHDVMMENANYIK